ncbi:MAG: TonB-dependent receptor [Deltaproteobacteria bacterium]|nr:TonB-dependent receptor [Deltaproteobacteria bacterium]
MKKCNRIDRATGKTTCYFALLLSGMMLLCNPVFAQDVSSSAEEEFVLEELVITGSRIRTTGMEMPTPVTVVTLEEIEVLSPTTMIEGLAQLPQFYGSDTTQVPSGYFTSTGAGSLNLRGLNSKRTLQLLDGRRVVPSTIFGGPDMNLFPESLVISVETVTGGASAAYGTDAVAGVVNFILNTEYEGIKGRVQYGKTDRGHNENSEYSISGGFALSDKAHLLISVERSNQDPIWGYDLLEYEWYDAWSLIENPDTVNRGTTPDNPYFLPARRVYSKGASLDGILLFPPYNDTAPRYIFDANGVATPFVNGDLCNTSGCSTVNGGSGIDNIFETSSSQITPKSGRENVFSYIDYDVTDQFNVYGQVIYGVAEFTNKNFGGLFPHAQRFFTIYPENPFLPDNMQQLFTDNPTWASARLGRIGGSADLGFDSYLKQKTMMLSLTGGMKYDVKSGLFDGWQVKGYYQYGRTNLKAVQMGGIRLDRVYLAADVVTDPATGLPACNVTVTSGLYPDCVPLNMFGRGQASAEAIDWVTGFEPGFAMNANGVIGKETLSHSYTSGINKQRVVEINQHVWEVSADGEIYDGWGAGPIRMGVGYGYRKESFTQVVEVGPGGNINADPIYRPVMANDPALGIRGVPGGAAASGNLVEIQFSNVPFARGEQDVWEAFDELIIPVLADYPFIKQLSLNGSARWARYSGAGNVYSWKGGLQWSVFEDLRLRGTISQDVRAATMGEKFDRTGGLAFITDYLEDPAGGSGSRYFATSYSNGSPDIKPEKARTHTAGIVYMPRWLKGLSISTDWYSVNVTDNINQIGAGAVVSGCYLDGNVDYCNLITRTGDPSTIVPGLDRISLVGVPYLNQASVKGVGLDFEIGYRTPVNWLGGGENVGLRVLASYLGERSNTSSAGVKTEVQGNMGFPRLTAIISGNYNRGPLGLSMQARYTSEMLMNANWNYNGASTRWDVFDNTVDATTLVDARVNYRFDVAGVNWSLYFNVNNLFDKQPEQYLMGAFSSAFGNDTGLGVTGDLRGRRYVLGLGFEFK